MYTWSADHSVIIVESTFNDSYNSVRVTGSIFTINWSQNVVPSSGAGVKAMAEGIAKGHGHPASPSR